MPQLARAQQPDEPEAVLADLRLGRSDTRTTPMYRTATDALIPAKLFCEMAELTCTQDAVGNVTGLLQPGALLLQLRVNADSARLGARAVRIAPGQLRVADGDLYVSTTLLGALFQIVFEQSWADLAVWVSDINPLPVGKRLQREATRRAMLAERDTVPAVDRILPLARPRFDGVVFDYQFGLQSGTPLRDFFGTVAMGTNVAGGALVTAWSRTGAVGAGTQPFRGAWTGVWREQRWLRQLVLGDAGSTGPNVRTIRGVTFGNSPYLRPSAVGQLTYSGMLGAGWTVEAYSGGRLIGFDSLAGRQQWTIPLSVQYGENLVDFVAYGPFGETRTFSRAYRVLGDMIPARTMEYGVAVGQCTFQACRHSLNTDLRWAPSQRLTLRVGYDQFTRDTLPTLQHPYVGATATWGDAISASVLSVAQAQTRLFLAVEPSFNQRYFLNASVTQRGVVAPLLSSVAEKSRIGLQAILRPGSQRDRFFVDLSAQRIATTVGTTTFSRAATSWQQGALRLQPFTRLEQTDVGPVALRRSYVGSDLFSNGIPQWGSFFRSIFIRASVEREVVSNRMGAASALVGRLFGGWLRVEAGAQWTPLSPYPTWLFFVNGDRRQARSVTTGTYNAANGASFLTQQVQGAFVIDPSARDVGAWRGPAVDRGGIAGRVFLDRDGDGVRGATDEPMAGVTVRVGGSVARTDAKGEYHVWDLVPFEPVVVEVDGATLASPLWVIADARTLVTPAPHRYTLLDVVVQDGGTIDGRVVRYVRGRTVAVPSVPLELSRPQDREVHTATAFTDGDFSVLGLAAGTWDVRVADRYLRASGLAQTPRTVTVRARPDGDQVTGVQLVLRPNPLTDDDQDGVADDLDACPGTPLRTPVDAEGCGAPVPTDEDGDLVDDTRDQCPRTPIGTAVDAVGCRLLFASRQRTIVLRDVTFTTGKAVLTAQSFAALDNIALALADHPDVRIEIGGHTDSVGKRKKNRSLSEQRAEVVRYYLARRGIALERMLARGYGPDRPIASNATAEGRALNRRTELVQMDSTAAPSPMPAPTPPQKSVRKALKKSMTKAAKRPNGLSAPVVP